jgi:hypothetical protein
VRERVDGSATRVWGLLRSYTISTAD